jgi:TRAP-type transport system small permease protein
MKNILDKYTNITKNIFAFGAGLSMLSVFLIIFINSTRRYAVGSSLEWGEQLPVFMAIYGVMFGVAWAYMNDQHVKFTILLDFLPKSIIKKFYMVVDVITIITGVVMTYSGYLFATKRGNIEASGLINTAKELKELTGIDSLITLGQLYPYQMSIAVGGVMLTIAAVFRLLNRFYEPTEDKIVEVA